jgi:hypothetical protein
MKWWGLSGAFSCIISMILSGYAKIASLLTL